MLNLENENFPLTFGILALTFLFMNYELGIRMVNFVKKTDPDFKFSFFRINIFKIAKKYKEIKKQQRSSKGKGYYAFYITFFLFILFFFLAIFSLLI
jgi:hypothetical protein